MQSFDDKAILELESEIRYLRQLLDSNGIAYDYQAYKESLASTEEGGIEFPELTREHAIAFYGMFRGRKDIFSQRSAKKGYHTKCNNFWKYGVCPKRSGEKMKCLVCPNQDFTKLNVPILLEHLKGEKEDCTDVIGLYPLFPDGTCWFLVFDFDNHGEEEVEPSKDWQQEVDALRRICEINGIDALVERSRSGRGAHVWVFFSEAIQASKVRRFGEALIVKGAESVSMKDFSYFDRMLPMQDFLPEGKIGNMVALPLQGRAWRKGNSAFVDENWRPYWDQWGRLLSTRLRTYKKIGFEVCSEVADNQVVTNSIFDSSNYLEVFEKDVLASSSRVVISSPSLSARKINRLISLTQDKGVSVVVFTRDPDAYPEDGREHHKELIQRLHVSGVRVVPQIHCCERYALIDNSLVWYGSMNLLSNEKEDDNLMRLVSPAIAEELLEIAVQGQR